MVVGIVTSAWFLASNDLNLKVGCWPGHHLMLCMQTEVSRSSSLAVFHPVSSLNLPHIESLVTGCRENDGLVRVESHFIDGASMSRQLIQNPPACGIPHIHKPVG